MPRYKEAAHRTPQTDAESTEHPKGGHDNVPRPFNVFVHFERDEDQLRQEGTRGDENHNRENPMVFVVVIVVQINHENDEDGDAREEQWGEEHGAL